MPRRVKQITVVGFDLLMCGLTGAIALSLRLDGWQTWGIAHNWILTVSVIIAVPIFTVLGLYRAIFRYADLQVLYTINKALLLYSLLFLLIFSAIGVTGVPRSMGLLQPMLFSLGVITSRLIARQWLGGEYSKYKNHYAPRVLVYGAGSAGRQLVAGMNYATEVLVVGYVDDDERLHQQVLNGLPIYSPKELASLVAKLGVTQIFLALPSASHRRRSEIIQSLAPLKLQVRTLPGLMDLTHDRVQVTDLKELDIDDLLGRDPVPPNAMMMAKNNTGKVVLVTGAGGSIGSELCRQILHAVPSKLLLVESTEFALYAIEQELRKLMVGRVVLATLERLEIVPLLGDVCNEQRMAEIMRTWQPHTVYHAAAYKHVPLVEHNPAEGLRNNVRGTWVVVEQAVAHGVANFVLVSTDKAVRPTNIMGASKRLAEMVLQALAQQVRQQGHDISLSIVRFGNVLGSSGSVVPLFRRQIQQGGPITLTDERITRYFMTIPEAAQLVIQSGAMAVGGDVFVLDMGESMRIIDLARKMIELSGLTIQDGNNPEGDIAIQVTGLRPGEKLYEELLIGDNPQPTQHARIMKAHEEFLPWPVLQLRLAELMIAVDSNDVLQLRMLIQQLVPGYKPDGDLVDWVHLEQRKHA
jgi:FlaA1/EpsC-like NDP-sugar epimerase